MIQLLVIADDFTGALDTGIQFRSKKTLLCFGSRTGSYTHAMQQDLEVLIIDAETRHLSPEAAGEIVGSIVAEAVQASVGCIYKKTDSGLRGNIGSELAAALKHSGRKQLHFIPALPKLNRISRNGMYYVDGQPVADSVFGKDPFEPVRHSDIRKILALQTDVPVLSENDADGEGIVLYDAATQADLEKIAAMLQKKDELHLLSGCAGFASALPELLGIVQADPVPTKLPPRLLTICGSINAITLKQMDTAENAGVPRMRLSVRQKLNDGWLGTAQAAEDLDRMLRMAHDGSNSIIECDGLSNIEELNRCRETLHMDQERMRQQISKTMGSILKGLLDRGLEATVLVTGGDTLMAFMELAELTEMIPICEYTPGVVLTQVCYNGKKCFLLSKSGGFGNSELLLDLEKRITANGYRN